MTIVNDDHGNRDDFDKNGDFVIGEIYNNVSNSGDGNYGQIMCTF